MTPQSLALREDRTRCHSRVVCREVLLCLTDGLGCRCCRVSPARICCGEANSVCVRCVGSDSEGLESARWGMHEHAAANERGVVPGMQCRLPHPSSPGAISSAHLNLHLCWHLPPQPRGCLHSWRGQPQNLVFRASTGDIAEPMALRAPPSPDSQFSKVPVSWVCSPN